MTADILIVDDESDIRELIAGILDDAGYDTRTAGDSDAALGEIQNRTPNLVILDIWLKSSQLDGLALLDRIKEQDSEIAVIVISGHGNIETAVSAIKRGAYDYIEKPFNADRLMLLVERGLENKKLRRRVRDLEIRNADAEQLVGQSQALSLLRQNIERVAATKARILIYGPSGSGKELTARMIHEKSERAHAQFVVVNAATITPERMEEELFGIEDQRGRVRKVGALENAHGGTLFLDEIADMPMETQGKILRVLVDQTFTRQYGSQPVKVDLRILSSTAYNLKEAVAERRFREDLFHRLAVVPIEVPPLSEHREDVPLLVDFFIRQISVASGLPRRKISDDATALLQAHDWPGNVRQLRNVIEQMMILTRSDSSDEITAQMLPAEVGSAAPPLSSAVNGQHLLSLPLRDARENFERDYLMAQIKRFGGNVSKTAEFVGMERSALHRKLKLLGL